MTVPAASSSVATTDADLVRAYLGGDERSAAGLVLRHTAAVARFLAATGADPGDLDDLVQETFFRAFRRLEGWRGEASFRSWVFRIASNQLRDHYRRRRGRVVVALEDQDLAAHDDPAATLDARETERRLRSGLERLPRLQREVFLLRAQQGMDYDAIAETLGTARVHYHHAVRRLKELVT